jgi:hypothetical protein
MNFSSVIRVTGIGESSVIRSGLMSWSHWYPDLTTCLFKKIIEFVHSLALPVDGKGIQTALQKLRSTWQWSILGALHVVLYLGANRTVALIRDTDETTWYVYLHFCTLCFHLPLSEEDDIWNMWGCCRDNSQAVIRNALSVSLCRAHAAWKE